MDHLPVGPALVVEVEVELLVALADPFVAIETQEVVAVEIVAEEVVVEEVVALENLAWPLDFDFHLPFQLTFEFLAVPNFVVETQTYRLLLLLLLSMTVVEMVDQFAVPVVDYYHTFPNLVAPLAAADYTAVVVQTICQYQMQAVAAYPVPQHHFVVVVLDLPEML